jgi:hypothetical protein
MSASVASCTAVALQLAQELRRLVRLQRLDHFLRVGRGDAERLAERREVRVPLEHEAVVGRDRLRPLD